VKSVPPVQRLDPVRFDARLYRQMIDHLLSSQPNEGCGLIAFHKNRPVKLYPGTNVHPRPADHYRMDDNEVVRAINEMDREGWWLGGIYHSHPHSDPSPSSTDLREANWPDALMIVVSLRSETPQTEAYRLVDGSPRVVSIEVRPDWGSWFETVRDRVAATFVPRPANGLPHVASMSTGSLAASGSEQVAVDIQCPPISDGKRRAVVGILGGMGPLATADLYTKIIQSSPAANDQEHIPVVMYADPRVPDRTEALLRGGEDPTPWLIHGARQLVTIGADFIVIPCNTAHAFLDEVQLEVERPIVSMIEAAADMIFQTYPQANVVGLLATGGTIGSEMYQQALRRRGIDTIVPDSDIQRRCVMAAIGEVKAGRAQASTTALLAEAGESLELRGADVLLAACTEIPVVLQQRHVGVPLVDATDALAQLAVKTAIHLEDMERAGEPQWETSTIGWTFR
jgi:aspartate racemase